MRYFVGLMLIFLILKIQGQDNAYLTTPSQSIRTHLNHLQEDNYNDSIASLPFLDGSNSRQAAIEASIRWKQILDGTGTFINLNEVPFTENYFDSTRRQHKYVITSQYPDIYLELINNKWVYPTSAIDAINVAHDELFPLGIDRLLDLLPKIGTREIFGLHFYQYVAIFILALFATVVQKILSFLFNRILLRLVKQAGYDHLAEGYLIPVARPFSVFVVLLLVVLFLPTLQLPVLTGHYVTMAFKVLIPIFGTIVFYRIADIISLYLEKLAKKTEATLDDQLVPLVRKTLKTFIVVIGTLFTLSNLDIDILPLLTGLSIGGLAFALAAQDTIKNFFGSLMIFIDKPFQIGDWITSGDIDGNVEEVGFRSSRVRTFRNSLMYVPNSKLADATIDNHGLRKYRRFFTTIAVTYDTPPELIQKFVEGLEIIVKEHPNTRKDYYNVYFNDMGAFSLNIMFYIFFEVPTWPEELKARHEVLMEIMKLAKAIGINFAFPTQTLHMENFPGQPTLSPEYLSEKDTQTAFSNYFKRKN